MPTMNSGIIHPGTGKVTFPDGTHTQGINSSSNSNGSTGSNSGDSGANINVIRLENEGSGAFLLYDEKNSTDTEWFIKSINCNGNIIITENDGTLTFSSDVISLNSLADVNVIENSSIDGYVLYWNNSNAKWQARPNAGGLTPINLISFYPGIPTSSAIMLSAITAQSTTFTTDTSNCYAYCQSAPTINQTLSIFQITTNNSQIRGSITFTSGSTIGTIQISSSFTTSPGDRIRVFADSNIDTTFADIDLVIVGMRNDIF